MIRPDRRARRRAAFVSALLAVALVVALAAPATATVGAKKPPPADATFTVRGSVNQVAVLGAPAGAHATLRDGKKEVADGTVDSLGGLLFRNVRAGKDYRVEMTANGTTTRSAGIDVTSVNDKPPTSLYREQRLTVDNLSATSGYGYLRTRDGTTLSTQVVLPGPPDQGPYPTLVEYSGYDPSNPATGQPQYKLIAPLLGYAWVGVNIRGTGCSGGAFSYFETLQGFDGYDAIETVAAQPWSNGHVGMVGISYAGISQLFVARTRPPHLDGITPLSVIADTYRSTLYPGGIFNDGFALSWATERVNQNRWPNPIGAGWVLQRIANGDTECLANQMLRGQNDDLLQRIQDHPFYSYESTYDFPEGLASVAPEQWAREIKTPVFIAGAWQDEQTGGHWPVLLSQFTPHVLKRAYGQNGTHVDSLDPAVLLGMLEFVDIYVGHRVPSVPANVRAVLPALWQAITGVGGLTLPPDRFTDVTSVDQARRRYEADGPIHILWENGNAPGQIPGAPVARDESTFREWPIRATDATPLYLGAGGTLAAHAPVTGGQDSFVWDPAARPPTDYTGSSGSIWNADPAYSWTPLAAGKGASYATAPFTRDTAMAGSASADLWIRSSAPDTDLQVTLSEVRSDGTERYVQNGWLRASHRRLDPRRSTTLRPVQTQLERDAAPLPAGRFTKVRIEIFPFAHVFRAGTRLRITVEAPGGDRPLWTFATLAAPTVTDTIGWGGDTPSRLVLPVVPAPDGLGSAYAPCPSLRAQPCRAAIGVPAGT